MHTFNRSSNFPAILLFIASLLFFNNLQGQDYKLFHEDFETQGSKSWSFNNARQVDIASFKGEKSIEVSGQGTISYDLTIPEGVNQIVIRAWMSLLGTASRKNWEDGASIVIESVQDSASNKTSPISEGQISFINSNAPWTNVEGEVKIPSGVKKVRLICKNTLSNSAAYFDEIEVEKRQTGFVKRETPWANTIRVVKERASRLVKNGNFENGAQVWNPYWGFELSNISHTGANSCMIQNYDSGAYRGSGNDELFRIPKGTKKLKITAWIKADNVKGGPNPWETGAMLLSLTDDLGNEVPGGDAIARTTGTHDWRKFESYFNISERATNFKILLQLAASTGKIYFDDIVATPMTDEEFYLVNIDLKNPGFEELLSGWPTYAGEATKEFSHSGHYSLKVAGENAAWEMRMQSVSVVKNKKEFTLSVWIKTANITETPNSWEGARVYVEFKDINGIALNTEGIGRAVGNTDWQLFTKKITVPEDAVEFTISCGRANVSGNAYFDDLKLEY